MLKNHNLKETRMLKYSDEHCWYHLDDHNVMTIGVTDQAQKLVGKVIGIILPEVEDVLEIDDWMFALESDQETNDFYSAISGEVISVNHEVLKRPTILNQDTYERGWLLKVKLGSQKGLMTEQEYAVFMKSE